MNTKFYIIAYILCHFAYSLAYSQEILIEQIPANSSIHNEFAPFVHDSMLYFSSNRKHEILKTYLDQNNEPLYRLYTSQILKNDDYGAVKQFKSEKLSKLSTASINISPNGNKLFITQNQHPTIKESKGKENLFGIYIIETKNGNWNRSRSFQFNSKRKYSSGHPAISSDGKTLFFVSNKDGGYGEADIYASVFDGENWSEPKNLGETINTSGNEIFPFFHPSGRLYFSSNGINSTGDYDIYYTTFSENKWSKPSAMDKPINSDKDDYSCYVFPSSTEGYFASNRSGNDDIYKFTTPYPTFPDAKAQIDDNFCFTLFEKGPFKSDTLPYIYKWYFGDGNSMSGLEVRHCFPGSGNYKIHLNVIDTLANKDLFTVAEYELELKQTKQIYISAPDTIKVNTPTTLSAEKSVLEDFNPSQFYWYLDDDNKAKGVTITHIFRKKGTYTITCGATSVTNQKNKMSSIKQIIITD